MSEQLNEADRKVMTWSRSWSNVEVFTPDPDLGRLLGANASDGAINREQWVRVNSCGTAQTPERALLLAILKDAIWLICERKGHGGRTRKHIDSDTVHKAKERAIRDARSWVESKDWMWCFSFNNVIAILCPDQDIEAMRTAILDHPERIRAALEGE